MSPQVGPAGNLLLVEGNDDEHVIRRLCEQRQAAKNFRTDRKDNVERLLDSIEGHLREPELRALGIVADANTDPRRRWQSISDRIARVGIAAPGAPDPNGTVIDGEVRVGVWLMPDNHSPGELEDFIRTMIRPEDPIWPRAEQYIDAIPSEHRRFRNPKTTRAKVHAWLAAQERPRPMGLAIHAGDLDVTQATAQTFLAWLQRCFSASDGGPPPARAGPAARDLQRP